MIFFFPFDHCLCYQQVRAAGYKSCGRHVRYAQAECFMCRHRHLDCIQPLYLGPKMSTSASGSRLSQLMLTFVCTDAAFGYVAWVLNPPSAANNINLGSDRAHLEVLCRSTGLLNELRAVLKLIKYLCGVTGMF